MDVSGHFAARKESGKKEEGRESKGKEGKGRKGRHRRKPLKLISFYSLVGLLSLSALLLQYIGDVDIISPHEQRAAGELIPAACRVFLIRGECRSALSFNRVRLLTNALS